ncbi:unnamed protein product, partial [marine sediment metagenome]
GKMRYMKLIEAICCVAKFGPIDECDEFGRECHKLDVMEQDKSDPQPWMEENVRLNCLRRIDDDRLRFREQVKKGLKVIKLEALKVTFVHLAALLYIFHQYQMPLMETEEEAVRQKLEGGDPFKQMIGEIEGEIQDDL